MTLHPIALTAVVVGALAGSSTRAHAQPDGQAARPEGTPTDVAADATEVAESAEPAPPHEATSDPDGDDEPRVLVVAGDPEPPPVGPAPPPPPPRAWTEDGAGPRLSFGRALTLRVNEGWYGRLESEYFERRWGSEGDSHSIGGILLGVEGWGAMDGGGGGGVPMMGYGGFIAPFDEPVGSGLFGTLGLGWSWVIYDHVYGNGGFGIFAPLAGAHLGVDLVGVRLLAEARVSYRWQWGARDRSQGLLGASLSINTDD